MSFDEINRRRRMLSKLAKLEKAAGIKPGPSKVGDINRRLAKLEALQRRNYAGGTHDE